MYDIYMMALEEGGYFYKTCHPLKSGCGAWLPGVFCTSPLAFLFIGLLHNLWFLIEEGRLVGVGWDGSHIVFSM